MMEKRKNGIINIILASLLGVMLALTGCEQIEEPELSALSVDSTQTTGTGIGIGASFDDFVKAYGMYHIQRPTAEGSFEAFEIVKPEKDMPYETEDAVLMVSGFFVDEAPVSTEELKQMTGCESIEELSETLSSTGFLQEHRVVFKYILFTVNANEITDIAGDYLDYNEEL